MQTITKTTKTQCPHCEAMLKAKFFNAHVAAAHGSSYRNG